MGVFACTLTLLDKDLKPEANVHVEYAEDAAVVTTLGELLKTLGDVYRQVQ